MLVATNLCKYYGAEIALNNLNLNIKAGEIFVLLGHNGAGKTTTIDCFLGFTKPTSGEAVIDELNVEYNTTEIRKKVAYIPDNVSLYLELNAIENLSFFCSLADLHYEKEELVNFLNEVGLPLKFQQQPLRGYSKGMKQKVGIAIALAKKAKVLFLDEPTSFLDPKSSNELCNIISDLRNKKTTVLMSSHDLFRSKNLASRIGIMKNGELVSVINPSEININELEKLYLEVV